jgi:uncharacterized protein (DUF2252 family)
MNCLESHHALVSTVVWSNLSCPGSRTDEHGRANHDHDHEEGVAMGKVRRPSGKGPEPAPVEVSPPAGPRLSRAEQIEVGKGLRFTCPRRSHAAWQVADHRPDPVALLEQSSQGRISRLIPVRYGRMMHSPLAFYRGAALNMAADLAGTTSTGLRCQICGDCHLLNFGSFATPERHVVFDINDFDETLPAPWEWDVKRLAASFVLACRDNSFSDDQAREAALACVRSYRERTAEFSEMRVLDVWYSRIDLEEVIPKVADADARRRIEKQLVSARQRSNQEHDDPKLASIVGQEATIRDNPPLIYHLSGEDHENVAAQVRAAFAGYRRSLPDDRRLLLDRFETRDIAVKVVGVGSVGTWCCILLMLAGEHDPLFLQVKEARPSVLEAYAGPSVYANHGQRIVSGCRLMQSASDLFLGWTAHESGRHFYVRQLKDMKIKPLIDVFSPGLMLQYAQACGWALARAHARSGEPAKVTGYLGRSDVFDEAIADFSMAYADQSERDHAALEKAVREGRLEMIVEGEA